MKPNEDITQQESTLNIQEPTAAEVEVKVEVEAEAAPVPVPAETPAEDTIENPKPCGRSTVTKKLSPSFRYLFISLTAPLKSLMSFMVRTTVVPFAL